MSGRRVGFDPDLGYRAWAMDGFDRPRPRIPDMLEKTP
jgi:hypothetical protein